MVKVIVASSNPVKIQAVFEAFQEAFPTEELVMDNINVPSGVSDQPTSNAETLEGAVNRARRAQSSIPNADYWVGVEGGVQEEFGGMNSFAWVCVKDHHTIGKARSGTFFLPEPIAELIRQGKELGDADDIIFLQRNSKQCAGAVGLLTKGIIDRTALYKHATILSLIPFLSTVTSENECKE
jgi:inosine/xanthosine triphosphatase